MMITSLIEKMRAKTSDTGLMISAFADGLVDAGLSRIPPRDSQVSFRPSYHGSVQTHLELLEHGRTVIYAIPADSRVHDAAVPTLFHPDLHKRNIFVSDDDPSIITGIIDWQSLSIEPAFWYADEVPDFATCSSSSGSSAPSVDDDYLCMKTNVIVINFLHRGLLALN
jgi:Predicted aminoglycoside phosphotransferase